jgi:hypothetical protein
VELTVTVRVAGVVPVVGVTISQFPMLLATVVPAEKVIGEPELLTVMLWEAGGEAPAAWLKFSVDGLTTRLPAVTVSVTGMVVSGVPLLACTSRLP